MDVDKLIEAFLKFPGIGPRQAKRFVFFLAGESKDFVDNLSGLIASVKNGMKQCQSCFRYFDRGGLTVTPETPVCGICSNLNRDASLLMAVEKDVDLENIERAGIFDGRYFVLGGVLSLSGNGKTEIRLKQLFEKVKKETPKEVILATSATIEGENTNVYIERILEPLKVKVSRLGRGLSTGAELEYSDSDTISNALKNRK